MKITMRILRVFILTTLLGLFLSMVIGFFVIDYFDKGDLGRNAGRINAFVYRIEGEQRKQNSNATSYASLYSNIFKIEQIYGLEGVKDILQIDEKFDRDKTMTKVKFDSNFEIESMHNNEALDSEVSKEVDQIVDIFKENIKKDEKNLLRSIYGGEKFPYIVSSDHIRGENNDIVGAILTIDAMDEEYIKSVEVDINRQLNIVSEMNLDGRIAEDNENGIHTTIVESGDIIRAYREIKVMEGSKQYYAEQIDNRIVRDQSIKNIMLLISLLFLGQVLINFILYTLIKHKIVDRIVKMNKSVSNIVNTNNTTHRLQCDNLEDEITVLATDINEMLINIDDAKVKLEENTEQLSFIANYDTLTKLFNRHYLIQYINVLTKKEEEFSIFFIDIDNFKTINDTAGHNDGDQVLCLVANELRKLQSKRIMVGRLGGDEFIVINVGINKVDEIIELGNRINECISKTVSFGSIKFDIKASIGASLFPQQGESVQEILQYADIAMYNSKREGGNGFALFNNMMYEELLLGAKISKAIKNGEIIPYYQPIYDVVKGKIIGAEALARWNDGENILVPDKFINIAKKTGDIMDLDYFMLNSAAKYCKYWVEQGLENFQVSINISYMFLRREDFVNTILFVLQENAILPHNIKLEITEDEIIDDIVAAIEALSKLRTIGVKVSLDDFGTGYSSFNYIKTLPLDTIKIDKSLLSSLEDDSKTRSIIDTLIKLCHNLGLNVICEGVEQESQLSVLENLNCNMIQGYIISPPVPKEEFDELIEKYNK
ncbi:MAG: EAL domain-containing protein [Clostridium sp.]